MVPGLSFQFPAITMGRLDGETASFESSYQTPVAVAPNDVLFELGITWLLFLMLLPERVDKDRKTIN